MGLHILASQVAQAVKKLPASEEDSRDEGLIFEL